MDEAEYHAHPALSHSQLEDFIEPNGSPGLFWGRHVAKVLPPFADTEATSLGTALHAAALEGLDRFEEKVAIWRGGLTNDGKPTTNRNSTAYREWKESIGNRVEIDPDDEDTVAAMLDALRQHDDAGQLLWAIDGESEKSLFWRDLLDVEARCRLDRVLPSVDIIVDIKTARDVSPKARAKCIAERGYHRKAEWYRRGYQANYGRPLREFLLVWVCTSPTSTIHDRVVVSSIGAVAEALAGAEIDAAIRDIVRRRESNDWRPPWCVGVQVDELAPWAINRELLQEIAQ